MKTQTYSNEIIVVLALILAFFLSSPLRAAGPDGYGYSSTSGTYQFITPDSRATTVLGMIPTVAQINLDARWGGIYGTPVSSLRVSRHGYLSFDLQDPGDDFTPDCPLPATPSEYDNDATRIYAYHLKLTKGTVKYQHYEKSPHPHADCGVHVITWQNVQQSGGSTDPFSFQILLFDNLDILIQYEDSATFPTPNNATVGIQNSNAKIGLSHACGGSNPPAGGTAVLITPPTLTVTTAADELNTPSGAELSFREAVRDATSGTRILFDPAVFAGFSRQKIDLTASGLAWTTFTGGKAIAVEAPSHSEPVILDALGGRRHFQVQLGAWLSLCGMELRNGSTQLSTLGGSVTVDDTNSTLIASHCRWSGNDGSRGGAIYVDQPATCVLANCDFTDNTADNGGALYATTQSFLSATHCRFYKNRAGVDGGVAFANGTLSTMPNRPNLRFNFCEMAMNEAGSGGGAISALQADIQCNGVTFDNNRADAGGAFRFRPIVPGNGPTLASFLNCTFYENKASGGGGAIFDSSDDTIAEHEIFAYFCTFLRNDGGSKGGALNLGDSDITMAATVIADNVAGLAADQISYAVGGTAVILNEDLNVETGSEAGFSSGGGISNVTDIGLTDLGYFGGFVRTCMPLAGSPLLDTVGESRSTDARELDGIVNGFADAGATEVSPVLLVTTGAASGAGSLPTILTQADAMLGATIRFSGVTTVTLFDSLPSTKSSTAATFIEGSASSPVIINNFGMKLAGSRQIAIHGCRLRGGQNSYLGTISPDSDIALDHCELSYYRYNALNYRGAVVGMYGGRFSSCHVAFQRNRELETVNTFNATAFMRDTQVAFNTGMEPIQSSSLRFSAGTTFLQRCSIVENELWTNNALVAGIRVDTTNNLPIDFDAEDTTIANNKVTSVGNGDGAGFFLYNSQGAQAFTKVDLRHCTITGQRYHGNSDSSGLYFLKSVTAPVLFSLKNSIISDNHGGNFNPLGLNIPTIFGGGNLCDGTIPNASGSANIENTDPLLSGLVLGQNGNLVRVPRPGSPAIDAAVENDFSNGGGFESGNLDGRGGLRSINASDTSYLADIGAVEAGRILTVTTAVDENNGIGSGAGASLREVLALGPTYGTIGVGFAPALNNANLIIGSQFALSDTVADIDDSGLTLNMNVTSNRMFRLNSNAALSLHGAHVKSVGGVVQTSLETVASLVGCEVSGTAYYAPIETFDNSAIHLGETWVHDVADNNYIMRANADSTISLLRSAITDCPVGASAVDAVSFSRFHAKDSTFAKIGGGTRTIKFRDSAEASLDAVTLARNGGNIYGYNSTATCFLSRTILHQNAPATSLAGTGVFVSGGHNLTEKTEPKLDAATDIDRRAVFLAPLSDYLHNGVPAMPPLAADRVAFDEGSLSHVQRGAFRNSDVITVTVEDDQNNVPAGAYISLREAIRDIPDGGTVVFDTGASGVNFNLVNGQISLGKSIRIDATRLPAGIRISGYKLYSGGPYGVGIFGVDFHDIDRNSNGGALEIRDGTKLALAHCTIQNCSGSGFGGGIYSYNADIVAENCSFQNNNSNTRGGAMFIQGGKSLISFCSFDENETGSDGGAISGNNFAEVTIHASSFETNTGNNLLDNVHMVATGVAISAGYNVFSDIASFAIASDLQKQQDILSPFNNYGGWVPGFLADDGSSAINHAPAIASGSVPPPFLDARGYPRVVAVSADTVALETGADTLDSDSDAIPDWWENFYGFSYANGTDAAANDDGDGANNLAEFLAGTDPLVADNFHAVPAKILATEIVDIGGPLIRITWIGQAGSYYRFQKGYDLNIALMDTGSPVLATGSPQDSAFPVNSPTGKEFFRIRPE